MSSPAGRRRRPLGSAVERPLVLDTHVWVWAVEGATNLLSTAALRAIEDAAGHARLYVSAISAWEIAMLVRKGRLVLSRDVASWVAAARRPPGVRIAPLTASIALDSTSLSPLSTQDPADRFVAATARGLGARLVTCDTALLEYGAAGQMLTLNGRP